MEQVAERAPAGAAGLGWKILIPGVKEPLSLSAALAITCDWDRTNKRRAELIDLNLEGGLSEKEKLELEQLQNLARTRRHLAMPLPMEELARLEGALGRSQ